ncbi:MAG: helix-turn-helix domain-containing protein [Candidatus Aenigmarchaeota archaeon]|nr:helix-turn-helix domain-containing protein [Candidatus Aenigmarchaeota archaeon]
MPEQEKNEQRKGEFSARFKEFLRKQYDKELVSAAHADEALEVDFQLLDKYSPEMAELLLEEPTSFFEIVEEAMQGIELPSPVSVRFCNIPESTIIPIRNLRSKHIGKFRAVEGIIRKASEIRPEITALIWQCPECDNEIEVERKGNFIGKPYSCECGNKLGFRQKGKNMIDMRWVMIEEPFELTEGERPSQVNLVLKGDLTTPDMRRMTDPGNRLLLTGVLKDIPKGKSWNVKLDFYMDINHVEPKEIGWERVELNKEDEEEVKRLAKDPRVYEKLVASLAPSLYGLEDVKESIILQLFGGVPRTMPDKTKLRGDIHVLIIGDPASGKCVTGDSKVVLNSGELKSIQDIVGDKLNDNSTVIDDGFYATGNDDLVSLSLDGKAAPTKANIFWKRKSPPHLYKLETTSGKKITVSPTHPFFVCSDGQIISKRAKELRSNDFIAAPRKLSIQGRSQEIDISIERSRARNTKHIKIPKKTSPELCKFLAYVLAEGYIQKTKTSCTVWFTNSDPTLLRDFERCSSIFGIGLHKRKPHKGKSSWDYYLSSIELGRFLEALEPAILKKSRNKIIPPHVMRASNTEIAAFLQAFFDAEACVRKEQIELSSASYEMTEQIQVLLLRFGIVSQMHSGLKWAANSPSPKKRTYHRLTISGSDMATFKEHIGFISPRKSRILHSLKPKNSISDVTPNLSGLLKQTRLSLGLTQFQMGIPRTTYQHFERGDRNPTQISLSSIVRACECGAEEIRKASSIVKSSAGWKILEKVRKGMGISQGSLASSSGVSQSLICQYETGKCGKSEIKPRRKSVEATTEKVKNSLLTVCNSMLDDSFEKIQLLKKVEESDVFWDRVKIIEKIKSDQEWVYDLQIPGVHNFVANQVFVHNSQLLKLTPQIVPRGKYVSGKGTTAAGLTASVSKDEQFMGGWVLEAGAMVLANKGILAIDEFEKMSPEDQVAMHEALEQGCYDRGTEIIFEDGSTAPLGDFVEKFTKGEKGDDVTKDISDQDVYLLSSDFKQIKPSKAVAVRKHKEDVLYKILLNTGQKITITPGHPVFVLRKGKITPVKAGELRAGEYIPVPKRLSFHGKPQPLPIIKIPQDKKHKKISLPRKSSKELCEWIGLVIGEGNAEVNRSIRNGVCFSNTDPDILKNYVSLTRKLFSISPYIQTRERDSLSMVRSISKPLYDFVTVLGQMILAKSWEKALPAWMNKVSSEESAALLRGLFDGEGSVNGTYGTVTFSTTSKKLAQQVQQHLLRFGVFSGLYPDRSMKGGRKRGAYKVQISGKQNTQNFAEFIGFIGSRRHKLERLLKKQTVSSVWDHVPNVVTSLEHVKGALRLSDMQTAGYVITRNRSLNNISKNMLQKMLNVCDDRISSAEQTLRKLENPLPYTEFRKLREEFRISRSEIARKLGMSPQHLWYWKAVKRDKKLLEMSVKVVKGILAEMVEHKKAVENLRFICDAPVEWVRIKSISQKKGEQWVYDITMNPTGIFIGNGVICHNSVSIAKASIVATLPAQTSVLAGGNPKFSRFDPYMEISKQIIIPETLLGRFDLKFALRDVPNVEKDTLLVDHMLSSRDESFEGAIPKIPPETIRKYVAYAKKNCMPTLGKKAGNILRDFYLNTRRKSEGKKGAVSITLRQFEALTRLAEASAKIQLSPEVRTSDARRAIKLMNASLRQLGFDPDTGEIDIDRAEGGVTAKERSGIRVIVEIINELSEKKKEITIAEIEVAAKKENVLNVEEIIDKLKREGMLFEPNPGYVQKA